jgi:hypothetical protein
MASGGAVSLSHTFTVGDTMNHIVEKTGKWNMVLYSHESRGLRSQLRYYIVHIYRPSFLTVWNDLAQNDA